MKRFFKGVAIAVVLVFMLQSVSSFALSTGQSSDDQKYYIGTVKKTSFDKGYSGEEKIDEKDPHFGWNIGRFFIDGYTSVVRDDENPVFLKNVGDKVTLWFRLEQDLDALNGNDKLSIAEDKNGYDQYFGVPKTNFGRGTLIIKYWNYQHLDTDPQIYTDYFSAGLSKDADTTVQLFEEGDYEVALDYEIKKIPVVAGISVSITPSYTNYRIYFKFSVRNGNCMVFPFDCNTRRELTNSSIAENGFYLDLARSRYLDINVKREVMTEGADGLVSDVRFNRPAKDGEEYKDEGIYTITVKNNYTNQETIKKIYVGKDSMLKAYVVTGLSYSEIKSYVAAGATISDDGTIVYSSGGTEKTIGTVAEITVDNNGNASSGTKETSAKGSNSVLIVVIVILVFVILAGTAAAVIIVIIKKKGGNKQQ